MDHSQLKDELQQLITALLAQEDLDTAPRTAVEQYQDISNWNVELPDDQQVVKILAEIWKVRTELNERRNIANAITQALSILRIFFPF